MKVFDKILNLLLTLHICLSLRTFRQTQLCLLFLYFLLYLLYEMCVCVSVYIYIYIYIYNVFNVWYIGMLGDDKS